MRKFNYCRHKNTEEKIIDFLTRRFPYNNSEHWRKSILAGTIRVNNQLVSPKTLLRNKDIVSYNRPRSEEPKIDDRYRILYEDDYILAAEKSGNLPVAESGQYHYNTLINILKEREKYPSLFAVHRLDKETSGVVLIARKKEVATQLGKQFLNNTPVKIYHAILTGELLKERVMVEKPIKKSSFERSKVRIRQVIDPLGKSAKTLFIAENAAEGLTLARIRTYSGRTHQIRCHAEYIGHPVLGDKLYGQNDERFINLLKGNDEPVFPPFGRVDRQLLHASSLSFIHPKTKAKTTFVSDHTKGFFPDSVLKKAGG